MGLFDEWEKEYKPTKGVIPSAPDESVNYFSDPTAEAATPKAPSVFQQWEMERGNTAPKDWSQWSPEYTIKKIGLEAAQIGRGVAGFFRGGLENKTPEEIMRGKYADNSGRMPVPAAFEPYTNRAEWEQKLKSQRQERQQARLSAPVTPASLSPTDNKTKKFVEEFSKKEGRYPTVAEAHDVLIDDISEWKTKRLKSAEEFIKNYPEVPKYSQGWAEDVLTGIAHYGVSMGLTAITGGVAAFPLMAMQMVGEEYNRYRDEGVDPDVAWKTSLISGGLQAIAESGGAVFELGKMGKIFKALKGKGRGLRDVVFSLLQTGAGEGLEEVVQGYIQKIADSYAHNPDDKKWSLLGTALKKATNKKDLLDLLNQGIMGFAGGVMLAGLPIAVGGAQRTASWMTGGPIDLVGTNKGPSGGGTPGGGGGVKNVADAKNILQNAEINSGVIPTEENAAIPTQPQQVENQVVTAEGAAAPMMTPAENAPIAGTLEAQYQQEKAQAQAPGVQESQQGAPVSQAPENQPEVKEEKKGAKIIPFPKKSKEVNPDLGTAAMPIDLTERGALENIPKASETKEPSWEQIEALNAPTVHINYHGIHGLIENVKGSWRRSKPGAKNQWKTKMKAHYGRISGVNGADGEGLDFFMGEHPESDKVFVIDQVNPETGEFDEHKVMLGYKTKEQARVGYRSNYAKGWSGAGNIVEMTVDQFKKWMKTADLNKEATAQPPITREEWRNNPESRPQNGAYSNKRYLPKIENKRMRTVVNALIDREYDQYLVNNGYKEGVENRSPSQLRQIARSLGSSKAGVANASNITPVKPRGVFMKALSSVAKTLKIPVVFFDSKINTEYEGFNGFYDINNGVIAINIRSQNALMSLIGHESTHLMSAEHPGLYTVLHDIVWKSVDMDAYNKFKEDLRSRRENLGLNEISEEMYQEEYIANLIGVKFTEREFWKEVFKRSETLGQKLSAVVLRTLDVMDKMLAKLTIAKGKNAKTILMQRGLAKNAHIQYAKDAEKIRRAVADAYAKMAEERDVEFDTNVRGLALKKEMAAVDELVMGEKKMKGGKPVNVIVLQTKIDPQISFDLTEEKVKSKEFKKWIGKSKVKHVVYHATNASDFNIFRPGAEDIGMHFGTAGQADERLAFKNHMKLDITGARVIPAYIRLENPLRVEDPGDWNPESVNILLESSEKFSSAEMEELRIFSSVYSDIMTEIDLDPENYDIHDLEEVYDDYRDAVVKLMHKHGYDGFVYENTAEIPGTMEAVKEISLLESEMRQGKAAPGTVKRVEELKSVFRNARENAEDSWAVLDPKQVKGFFNDKPSDSAEFMADIEAHHGSPYKFEEFSTEKIGSGEGAQAFGWGLYYTQSEGIARGYAKKLGGNNRFKVTYKGGPIHSPITSQLVKSLSKDELRRLGAKSDLMNHIQSEIVKSGQTSHVKQLLIDHYEAILAHIRPQLAREEARLESRLASGGEELALKLSVRNLKNSLNWNEIKLDILQNEIDMKDFEIKKNKTRNLYTVDLFPGKKHPKLLHWYNSVSDEDLDAITSQAEKEGWDEDDIASLDDMLTKEQFKDAYRFIMDVFGMHIKYIPGRYKSNVNAKKEASLFLKRAGFDGIEFPAMSLSGTLPKPIAKAKRNFESALVRLGFTSSSWTNSISRAVLNGNTKEALAAINGSQKFRASQKDKALSALREFKNALDNRPMNYVVFDAKDVSIKDTLSFDLADNQTYATGEKKAGPKENILVRDGDSNLAMVQISSNLDKKEAAQRGEKYYKKLYEKRQGYERPADFWELPEWQGRVANTFSDVDALVVRNPESAINQLDAGKYDTVFFSAMDANKAQIKKIAQGYDGQIYIGGYVDPSYFAGIDNVTVVDSVEEAAKKAGVKYQPGVDWRHYKGTKTIPRLECSQGCLHHCAFCTVPKKIVEQSKEQIDEQIKNFKGLDYRLVYLNDKTFGQAANYKYLPEIYKKLKKQNPKFEGFIVQTTAPQFLKLDDKWLEKSGIKFVELGVESYNDKILRAVNKPHNEEMLDRAADKLRRLRINFIPNIIVGLAGTKNGKLWTEDKETYQHTLDFLHRNSDIISHVNVTILATYTGTKITEQLGAQKQTDKDQNVIAKSWMKDRKVHDWFYDKVLEFGSNQLDKTPTFEGPAKIYWRGSKGEVGVLKRKPKRGAYYFMSEKDWAEQYGRADKFSVRVTNTWDYKDKSDVDIAVSAIREAPDFQPWMEKDLRSGDWEMLERPEVREALVAAGFDSYKTSEAGGAIGVFSKSDIEPILPDITDINEFKKKKSEEYNKKLYNFITLNEKDYRKIYSKYIVAGFYPDRAMRLAVADMGDIMNGRRSTLSVAGGLSEDEDLNFDLTIKRKKKNPEGGKGTAIGNVIYWDIFDIARAAGGMKKVPVYLRDHGWRGIEIPEAGITYSKTVAKNMQDRKAAAKHRSIVAFRRALSAGEIDESSPEYSKAVQKHGAALRIQSVKRTTPFHVAPHSIYGNLDPENKTETVTKSHPIFGEFPVQTIRDKNGDDVIDGAFLPANPEERDKAIDDIVKKNAKYLKWYDDWNDFIHRFKNIDPDTREKYIKIMAVLSAQTGPQGNQLKFAKVVKQLEDGRELIAGSYSSGGDGISATEKNKIEGIWAGQDPATNLEERRAIYGNKVGTYMTLGLYPHEDGVVIDRHMPRLFGYDITWSANGDHRGFIIEPQVEAEVVGAIKAAAKRNGVSTGGVQAALWFASRKEDVEAATYEHAAQIKPSEYLTGVMYQETVPPKLGSGIHYKQTLVSKGDFIYASTKDGGIMYRPYSRNDIQRRIDASTDLNEYAPLVYVYEVSPGWKPENMVKQGAKPHSIDLNRAKIYDASRDVMGYLKSATERVEKDKGMPPGLKDAGRMNALANLIRQTGDYDGFMIARKNGNVVLLFDKAVVRYAPEAAMLSVSDVVERIEKLPQGVNEIGKLVGKRSNDFYFRVKSIVDSHYPALENIKMTPTISKFGSATSGKLEVGAVLSVDGPKDQVDAFAAQIGIENGQRVVYVLSSQKPYNGVSFRIRVDKRFKTPAQLAKELARIGVDDFNIVLSESDGMYIDNFSPATTSDLSEQIAKTNVDVLSKIADKSVPVEIVPMQSKVLGDYDHRLSDEKYLEQLRKIYGERGDEVYAESKRKKRAYLKKIRRREFQRRVREGRLRNKKGSSEEGILPDIDFTPDVTSERPKWYSELENFVASNKFPGKGNAKMLAGLLRTQAQKGRFKQTELDWVGVDDWLDYLGAKKVTKGEVIDYIRQNNAVLEEQNRSGFGMTEDERQYYADTLLDTLSNSDYFKNEPPGEAQDLEDDLYSWVSYGDSIEAYQTIVDAIKYAHMEKPAMPAQYSSYSLLKGSPDYREVLVTTNVPRGLADAQEAVRLYNEKTGNSATIPYGGVYRSRTAGLVSPNTLQAEGVPEFLVDKYRQWLTSNEFYGPHFDEAPPNVVAHARVDSINVDGKKTLLIDEIQSDWAKIGEKQGWKNYKDMAPLGYHFNRVKGEMPGEVTYELIEDKTGEVIAASPLRENALSAAGFMQEALVTPAPFRTSKEYTLLILKRAVMMAANEGYDQIAWTSGSIQSKRYSLGNQVSAIYATRQGVGAASDTVDIEFVDKNDVHHGSIGDRVLDDLTKDEVAELVGKDLATKIFNNHGKEVHAEYGTDKDGNKVKVFTTRLYDGLDLEVGGEGMRGFYDKIVPSVFKKFFGKKKWGSPSVKSVDYKLPYRDGVEFFVDHIAEREGEEAYYSDTGVGDLNDHERFVIEKRDDGWCYLTIVNDSNGSVSTWGNYSTLEEAKDGANDYAGIEVNTGDKEEKLWVVPITKEMKEKAQSEGMPMFDIETKPTKDAATVIDKKIGMKHKPLGEKIKESVEDMRDNWKTRLFDRLNPIKEQFGEESEAYMLARGLGGTQSIMNAFFEHGKLKMDKDGAITSETAKKGFIPWLHSLGEDAEKFLYWQIAKRSEMLAKEGREKLLSDNDRKAILDWVGEKPITRDSWQQISDEFKEWNDNILDLAVESGLIDESARKAWRSDYYIPFYRVFEDEQAQAEFVRSPGNGAKVLSAGIKRLKGSERKIGDPMENIIKNWTHLVDQSIKNKARAASYHAAVDNGLLSGRVTVDPKTGKEVHEPLVEQVPWSETVTFQPKGKGDNKIMFVHEKTGEPVLGFKDKGKTVFFRVNDPELFAALSNVQPKVFDSGIMAAMGAAKRVLTLGATVTPAFRIANMLRDTLHTAMISKSFIPFWDTAKGMVKIMRNDPDYVKFMASGHAFGGSYTKADDPGAMAKYINRVIKNEEKGAIARVLDTPKKMWEFWEAIGDASENAARVALYSNLRQGGESHLKSAFSARDLMDFQMSGAAPVVRFLIQTVPFLNARIQGLYKLGRAAVDSPGSFMLKGAMIAAASLALWGIYRDDERYKRLEDWEKFAYYHFWVGDMHFRIPKPFETGVIFSSSIEAAANVIHKNDEPGLIWRYIANSFANTLAFNPVPQLVRPMAELYANKNFFTGRPIEPEYMKARRPGNRYNPWTSESLRLLGDKLNISPLKMETIIRGYLASLGTGILWASDLMVRNIADFPERPSMGIGDYPAIGRFLKSSKNTKYTKYMTRFYNLYNEVDQLVGTVNDYKRVGDFEKARAFQKKNRGKIAMRSSLNAVRGELSKIRTIMREIMFDKNMSAKDKREKLNALATRRNELVERVYKRYITQKGE